MITNLKLLNACTQRTKKAKHAAPLTSTGNKNVLTASLGYCRASLRAHTLSSIELRAISNGEIYRFHVLLNSLFKVLFNFPSRYLFAIGLVAVFSLRWDSPPALGCTLEQPDSTARRARCGQPPSSRALHPLRRPDQGSLRRQVVRTSAGPTHHTAVDGCPSSASALS
ncbi:hypothetical protein TTRE_0000975601 [Trichuris trichiura]|uniref:Uncharacterized protein n=1 Tax=Trichuris trichiura TaxID=36087 RepID=A0A077ZR44_TRITR|nr:hypothetical protein TTRE_0000975601 [Trichuris trichiura]